MLDIVSLLTRGSQNFRILDIKKFGHEFRNLFLPTKTKLKKSFIQNCEFILVDFLTTAKIMFACIIFIKQNNTLYN